MAPVLVEGLILSNYINELKHLQIGKLNSPIPDIQMTFDGKQYT